MSWPSTTRDTVKWPDIHDDGSLSSSTTHLPMFLQAAKNNVDRNGYNKIEKLCSEKWEGSEQRIRTFRKMYERLGVICQIKQQLRLTAFGNQLYSFFFSRGTKAEKVKQEKELANRAFSILCRYQFDNPTERFGDDVEKSIGDIRPFRTILQASNSLDGKLHYEEINRVILNIKKSEDLAKAVEKIASARQVTGGKYTESPGVNIEKILGKESITDQPSARIASWFSLSGWGGLLISSESDSNGYRHLTELGRSVIRDTGFSDGKKFEGTEIKQWYDYYAGIFYNEIPDSEFLKAFDDICVVSKKYNQSDESWVCNDPKLDKAHQGFEVLEQYFLNKIPDLENRGISIQVAKGVGRYPKIPWLCFLPEGQQASSGVYVSICFDKNGRGAVVGFSESASNPQGLKTVKRSDKPIGIDVDGPKKTSSFNDGFVNPEEFLKDSLDLKKLLNHISTSLDLCLEHLGGNHHKIMTAADKTKFVSALEKSGFVAEKGLPEAFLQSLITKPFVILTGNSGTGKTKIAELLSSWLRGQEHGGHELVAVGADWTDKRNVLGFVNYLRISENDKMPVYQSTHLLDLLLRARTSSSKPFFLILDEMNLSHVERYFADFLSAMETKKAELDLHSEGGDGGLLPVVPGGPGVVPRKVSIPSNFFVIGTVNVDETTYMFSPKVLDRANVIEFRMPDNAAESFFAAGKSGSLAIDFAGNGVAERFLSFSVEAREDRLPDPSNRGLTKGFAEALNSAFTILQNARLEFGFRTINEIRRYFRVDYALTANTSKWDWQEAFDAQLYQKILPKLSGSRRRMDDLLVRLAAFCENGKNISDNAAAPAHLQSIPVKRKTPVFKKSYLKLCDMLDAVRRDQFVSFIH